MIEILRKKIEESYYWDARVKALECHYFADEIKLVFEGDKKDTTFYFNKCYKIQISHEIKYPKDINFKELEITQIPYFMQDVELKQIIICEKTLMEFKINLYPIELLIVCNEFNIY